MYNESELEKGNEFNYLGVTLTDFIADLIIKKEYRLARSFNLSSRYVDDVLSLNNPNFGDFIHRIYTQTL